MEYLPTVALEVTLNWCLVQTSTTMSLSPVPTLPRLEAMHKYRRFEDSSHSRLPSQYVSEGFELHFLGSMTWWACAKPLESTALAQLLLRCFSLLAEWDSAIRRQEKHYKFIEKHGKQMRKGVNVNLNCLPVRKLKAANLTKTLIKIWIHKRTQC